MDVLVLSWDARGPGGPSVRAAGLATSLARSGAVVRVVTRLVEGERPAVLDGCEVHAVPDAPPVIPDALATDQLPPLAFAGPALAVLARRLRERPADLTVAIGGDTLPVATRLPRTTGTLVLDQDPSDARPVRAAAAALATGDRDVVVCARATTGPDPLADRTNDDVLVLPAAGPAARRRPGTPPSAGPVRLVVPADVSHRRAAAALRATLAEHRQRRTVTSVDSYRPAVTVVLADDDEPVLHSAARGVPVVAVGVTARRATTSLFCGFGAGDANEAAALCAAILADPDRGASLGAAGLAASERARARSVALLRSLVGGDGDVRPLLRVVD